MEENKIIERIIKKSQVKIAISKFIEGEKYMPKSTKILKTVATIVITLGIGTGLVYATGTVVSEKIWKEPKQYKINQNLTDEERKECITQEKAEEIANNYLKKIGLEEEKIKDLNLAKNFFRNDKIWHVSTEKVSMQIDAESGKVEFLNIPTWNYKIPYNYGITREEARSVAKELLEKYRPEGYDGEYELVCLRRNMETDEASYIWYADFYRKYDNLINKSEQISIGWIPTINGLYSLTLKNIPYENNEQKISKEQAINITVEKDKQIEKNKTIKETKAEIRIKEMNEDIYLRENFKEEYENGTLNTEKTGENTYKLKDDAVAFKTEKRARKVWCVVINYNESLRIYLLC